MSRNQEQDLIMQTLYAALTYKALNLTYDLPELISGIFEQDFNDVSNFSKSVIIKTLAHEDEIKSTLEKNLVRWKWHRLSRLMQCILLMSYSHFHFIGEVDKAVVINIAVRLSKRYLNKDDYKFVNGILDKVL